ncbi:MAG TPA: winged helix-turn-helix domain-containing protein [Anaeromyxobacteraceae bacterium]|nr:winged helix-turn-helix domain-containing protein [Anaeromyxobacteraceae bacterium]
MTYSFGRFELDLARVELRADGEVRPVEPQVFALLALLVENRERLVSREEIVQQVWGGRIVSDAAVASRIKSAREALGDDGKAQRFIRTVHGRGLRFVAEARTEGASAAAPGLVPPGPADPGAQPSIAVLPFRLLGAPGPLAAIAEALPHELIAELARLRWLFVTARGSSFRLGPDGGAGEVGRVLGVRYCLAGTVELDGSSLVVTVELVDAADGGVVWADRLARDVADVHAVREEIRSRVVSALEIHVPLHEAARARLSAPENLDAWAAYHLGLQHMYRFNPRDNAAATAHFLQAIARDPRFARAHAGLSFVHFQTAFMRYTDDVAGETALARGHAARGLELDPLDPFVNFTMGRSYWLEGDLDTSLSWLERSVSLCPNYAQGIYACALTEALGGRGADGGRHVDQAMRLSPIDPLYYAFLGTRSFSHMALGDDAAAAEWADRAARSPGAHVIIAMIAAGAHAMAGDAARAATWAAHVHATAPALTREDFFRSLPMRPGPVRTRVDAALARLGL